MAATEQIAAPFVPRSPPVADRLHVPGSLGLRAIAVASTLIYHCWLYSSPEGRLDLAEPLETIVLYGRVGLPIMMTLSGFLLYLPFANSILSGSPLPSVGRFWRHRLLRILPAYWVILLIVAYPLGAALVRGPEGDLSVGSFDGRPDLLILNLLLLQNFWPDSLLTGIGPAWFVTAVLGFYLTLPLLARLGGALTRHAQSDLTRMLAALTAAAFLLALGWSFKLIALYVIPPSSGPSPGWDADWHSVLARSFLLQSDRFGFGIAAAVLWVAVWQQRIRLPRYWSLMVISGMLVAGPGAVLLRGRQLIGDYTVDVAMSFSIALLFLLITLPSQLPRGARSITRVLETRGIAAFGVISYSLFLWHEPIIRRLEAAGLTFPGPAGLAANVVVVGFAAGVLSMATYYLLERPFLSSDRRKAGRDRAKRMPRPVAPGR